MFRRRLKNSVLCGSKFAWVDVHASAVLRIIVLVERHRGDTSRGLLLDIPMACAGFFRSPWTEW